MISQRSAWNAILLVLMLATALPAHTQTLPADIQAASYRQLDNVVAEKQAQLETYLQRILDLAENAGEDPLILDFFRIKQQYWRLQQENPPPAEARRAIEDLKLSLRDHFLGHYQSFYDILFVDRSGFVLSTVRGQADYHKNLFEGDLAHTALAERLHAEPGTAFVDYEFFWVSDEPSAFFVQPVTIEGRNAGWLVLQCSLNRINDIFCHCETLGPTGETFLVNRRHQMMTESRLRPGGENLRRILSEENIEAKFRLGRGHRRVIDYRGFPALTSFTVCSVLGCDWLLVAKIDEDAVLTEAYRQHEGEWRSRLLAAVARQARVPMPEVPLPDNPVLVDMDEFRSSPSTPLLTFGVATCTAVVVKLPKGRAFMGHASENDRLYGQGSMDVLGQMLRRIRRFEVLPYQLRELEVVLAAPHTESLATAVELLLDEGILLSQIRFLHDPSARTATVMHKPAARSTFVRWTAGNSSLESWQDAGTVPTLADMLKKLPPSG